MIDFKEQDKRWFDKNYCLEQVKQNGLALRYIHNQTEEICIEAVKQNGDALIYVQKQTPLIVYYALEENCNLNVNLIHITESEWNEFKEKNPELFI